MSLYRSRPPSSTNTCDGSRLCTTPFTTVEEWTSLLDIATKYEFIEARETAIEHLTKMEIDPCDKIAIAQRYDIRLEWVTESLIHLSLREQPLTYEEASKLGMKLFSQLAVAREALRLNRDFGCKGCQNVNLQLYCNSCEDYAELPFHLLGQKDVLTVVTNIFGIGTLVRTATPSGFLGDF